MLISAGANPFGGTPAAPTQAPASTASNPFGGAGGQSLFGGQPATSTPSGFGQPTSNQQSFNMGGFGQSSAFGQQVGLGQQVSGYGQPSATAGFGQQTAPAVAGYGQQPVSSASGFGQQQVSSAGSFGQSTPANSGFGQFGNVGQSVQQPANNFGQFGMQNGSGFNSMGAVNSSAGMGSTPQAPSGFGGAPGQFDNKMGMMGSQQQGGFPMGSQGWGQPQSQTPSANPFMVCIVCFVLMVIRGSIDILYIVHVVVLVLPMSTSWMPILPRRFNLVCIVQLLDGVL